MSSGNDLRPLLGVLLVASLVLIVVNTVLFYLFYARKSSRSQSVATALGFIGALVWTIVMWPVMTGTASGGYIVRVNGVVAGGGLVSVAQGFVPLFITGLALLGAPRALGYGIWRLASNKKSGKKPGTPTLVFSLIGVFFGAIFAGTGASILAKGPEGDVLSRTVLVIVIGAIPLAFGLVGLARYFLAKRG